MTYVAGLSETSALWYIDTMLGLVTLFQSFTPAELFVFSIVFLIIAMSAHNRYRNTLVGMGINVASIIVTALLATSSYSWLLFALGTITYLFVDTIAVYQHEWRYNTKSGYVVWAAVPWGLMTVVISHFVSHFDIVFSFFFLLAALILVLSRAKKDVKAFQIDTGMLLFTLLSLLLMPKVFILAFGMGVILEYVAVTVFKAWSYTKLTFIQIGLGYGASVVSSFMVASLFTGHFRTPYLLIPAGLLLFQAKHFMTRATIHSKSKKKGNIWKKTV